nr:hypothetical protein [Devosia oryzisoli]
MIGSTASPTAMAEGVSFVVAVDDDVDLFAQMLARQFVGAPYLADVAGGEARHVLLHVQAEAGMNVDFEGGEAVRIFLEFVSAVSPCGSIGEITLRAVRVESDVVAELTPEQLADRLAKELAGKIPERHVDARQHLHLPSPLREDREHVVVMDAHRQRVLADELQVRQTPAAGGVTLDDRAGMVAVQVATLAIAGNPAISVDADQAEARVQPHRPDSGDSGLTMMRLGGLVQNSHCKSSNGLGPTIAPIATLPRAASASISPENCSN